MSQLIWVLVHLLTGKRRLTLRPHRLRTDPLGSGEFGAGRGGRQHNGIDIEVRPGEVLRSPYNMYIDEKPIQVYKGTKDWTGVRGWLETPQGRLQVKYFYIIPNPEVLGTNVLMGEEIGRAQDISKKYDERMHPHIHIEHWDINNPLDITNTYI